MTALLLTYGRFASTSDTFLVESAGWVLLGIMAAGGVYWLYNRLIHRHHH